LSPETYSDTPSVEQQLSISKVHVVFEEFIQDVYF
jgi:hypothetical protein